MTTPAPCNVIVVGRTPEKMRVATAVLEEHGFTATAAFSEDEARHAIADHAELLAVVAGGAIDEAGQDRLRVAAGRQGAVLITAFIGHDDPREHFTEHVIPKLIEARTMKPKMRSGHSGSPGSRPSGSSPAGGSISISVSADSAPSTCSRRRNSS